MIRFKHLLKLIRVHTNLIILYLGSRCNAATVWETLLHDALGVWHVLLWNIDDNDQLRMITYCQKVIATQRNDLWSGRLHIRTRSNLRRTLNVETLWSIAEPRECMTVRKYVRNMIKCYIAKKPQRTSWVHLTNINASQRESRLEIPGYYSTGFR